MTHLPTRFLGVVAVLALASGCADGPTEPANVDTDLAASFDQMAVEARQSGDLDGATAFEGGAEALRAGLVPSDIAVSIDGEVVIHQALVHAVARGGPDGPQVLVRSLLAWSGGPSGGTMLQVMLLADAAEFGHPSLATRARGWFGDLENGVRYAATSGGAGIQVASLGGPCGPSARHHPSIRCRLARFDVQVDGTFRARSSATGEETVMIAVNATAVAGTITAPAGFFGTP